MKTTLLVLLALSASILAVAAFTPEASACSVSQSDPLGSTTSCASTTVANAQQTLSDALSTTNV